MSSYSVFSQVIANKSGQMAPISGREAEMQPNKAGGYVFQVSDQDYILRCLILGTNKNTYYSSAREMTSECIDFLKKMIAEGKGQILVDTISKVYEDGRAPKQDPTLMALAIASSCQDLETRRKAYEIVSKLRTLSHVYTWKGYHKLLSKSKGMGRLSKQALCTLFQKMSPQQLSYQVTKYPHRNTAVEDWSFVDLLRCIHLKGDLLPLESQFVLKTTIRGKEEGDVFLADHPELEGKQTIAYMKAVETVKSFMESEDNRLALIKLAYAHNLPREVLPTWSLKHADVWRSLLLNREQTRVTMPMTALVRNLAVMTTRGVFHDALTTSLVVEHLQNEQTVQKARLHPVSILIALLTYKAGHGEKGKLSWTPHSRIVAALETAFYKSFKFVKATGKRIFHGIDCSGSMTSPIPCLTQISSHTAATVMAMTFARIESGSKQEFAGFSSSTSSFSYSRGRSFLRKINIDPSMSLEQAMRCTQFGDFGTTDCSLPIEDAIQLFKSSGGREGLWDVFMIYTDNETFAGARHPAEALAEYRKLTGIPAKMVVIATTPNSSTIADPADGGMLDVSGFDTNAPEIVMNFIRGDALDSGLEAGAVVAEEDE